MSDTSRIAKSSKYAVLEQLDSTIEELNTEISNVVEVIREAERRIQVMTIERAGVYKAKCRLHSDMKLEGSPGYPPHPAVPHVQWPQDTSTE